MDKNDDDDDVDVNDGDYSKDDDGDGKDEGDENVDFGGCCGGYNYDEGNDDDKVERENSNRTAIFRYANKKKTLAVFTWSYVR